MITIHALNCGEVGVDPAVPDRSVSRNALAYTGLFRSSKYRIWLPVKAFLIDHPKGKVLVDTGWDSKVRAHPIGAISFPMWFASKPRLPEGMAVDEQLDRLGIKPEELDYVVLTHMDIDHDSGLRLVKSARRLLASEEELQAVNSHQIRYVQRPLKKVSLKPIPFKDDITAPFGKSWDMFNDNSIIIYFTPGHSQGSVSLKVSGSNGFALIVGDTGYNRRSWSELCIPGPVYDRQAMKKALIWVQMQGSRKNCLAILAAHDIEEQRSIIELKEVA